MKKLKIVLQSNYFYYFIVITCILFIIINILISKDQVNSVNNIEYIEGVITNIIIKDDKTLFLLKSDKKVRCIIYNNVDTINSDYLGSKVRVYGDMQDINSNTIPNTFNYKNYMKYNKINYNYIVKNIDIIDNPNLLYTIKSTINKKINSYDDKVKPYIKLFILGDKTLLDENTYKIYQSNGICHLFAISGMHIGIIILALSKILKRLRYKAIFISLFLLFFMFLTNFCPSVERVCLFYFLKNVFEYLNIRKCNFKILILTCAILVLTNPFIIYNNGFLYSFIITLGIILYGNKISGNYFKKLIIISILSIIISLPITININYELNILAVLLNIIYVPFITFIFFPILIFIFFIPCLSSILCVLIDILELSNSFFDSLKIIVNIPKLSFIIIVLYYLFIIIMYKSNNYKFLIINILLLFLFKNYSIFDSSFYVNFFDVKQGDSSIIISPHRKDVILIDSGGIKNSNYFISDNIIIYLKSIGILKINTFIITHGDYDHMGEAINLVNNFKVEKVIFNCGPYNDLEKELIKVLDKKKIKYYSCIKELNIDKNKLYFLQTKEYDNENDNSNVIYTELNGYKFMFMGDASIITEKEILSKYNLPDIDVLKVGHHGSKTSSSKEFIEEIEPKYSVISVGKNNRYGHPNKEVLDNLNNSKIYRTDKDGSIMFKIKNNNLKIETCSP